MRMKTYQPYQMIKTANLIKIESKHNEFTDVNKPMPTVIGAVHYAQVKRTLTQKYLLSLGNSANDTSIIAIQHQDLSNVDYIQINGINYKIEDNSIDDSNIYIKYDLLTLSKVTKVGGTNG